MKTKIQREQELLDSGLVNSIKSIFKNSNCSIPEKYYLLIADYIDSIGEVSDSMMLDPIEIAQRLPSVISRIEEKPLGGIHGITEGNTISMNINMNEEQNKLYFFHELTHALQTRNVNGIEQCGFYDGKTGMFLTEAATQYTAEILYHVSNGTNLNYREQQNTVREHPNHTPYSPLSEYQFNGNILMLLSMSMDLPLPQVLSLAYKKNGRETLKQIYESMDGNQGKFENLMFDLEKIYSVDKLLIYGYKNQLDTPNKVPIALMNNETTFLGNLEEQEKTMTQVQRNIASSFILNHDEMYITKNYDKILPYLTTTELKQSFMNAVEEISNMSIQNNYEEQKTLIKSKGFINIISLALITILIGLIIVIIIK